MTVAEERSGHEKKNTLVKYGVGALISLLIGILLFQVLKYFSLQITLALFVSVTCSLLLLFIWNRRFIYKSYSHFSIKLFIFMLNGYLGLFVIVVMSRIFNMYIEEYEVLALFVAPLFFLYMFFVGKVQIFNPSIESLSRNICYRAALIFIGYAFAIIFLLSVFYTIPNWWEPFQVNRVEAIAVTILGALFVLILLAFVTRLLPMTQVSYRWLLAGSISFIVITGLTYALLVSGKIDYFADSYLILRHINGVPDSGTYFEWYPHQAGYAFLLRGLFAIFGQNILFPMYVLNVCANVMSVYAIARISRYISPNNWGTPIVALLLVTPTSAFLYTVPFLYGDLVGIALGLSGIVLVLRYLSKERKALWNLLGAGILLVLAVVVKGTLNIIVLALLICAVFEWIRKRDWSLLLASSLTVIFAVMVPATIAKAYSLEYGLQANVGTPRTTWIAMGLMSGDGSGDYSLATEAKNVSEISTVAPGAFNGYAWDLREDNPAASVEELNSISLAHIRHSIEAFIENPIYTLDFFLNKQAYLWADPTFSTRTFIEEGNDSVLVTQWGRIPLEEASPFLIMMVDNNSNFKRILLGISDSLQTVVYLGALIGIVLVLRRREYDIVGPLVTLLLGGIGVYLLWEAMPRFTFFYYLLTIPISAYGLVQGFEWLRKRDHRKVGERCADITTI